jgi:hypothetical protein
MLRIKTALAYLILLVVTVISPLQVRSETGASHGADKYPVKNDSASIKQAYSKPDLWDGRAVAVVGIIRSLVINTRGQPSLELGLEGTGNTTIWATWPLVKTDRMDSYVAVGQRLRVLGWLRDTNEWSKVTRLDLPRQTL